MSKKSRRDAVTRHRIRLKERGVSRYEVRGLARDMELVRKLAKRLAADDPAAGQLRMTVAAEVEAAPNRRGGILAALRRSPLVGTRLKLDRERTSGRNVDL